MRIQEKVVIVTGGAHGIGAALCRRFAHEGAEAVVVADIESEPAKVLADEIGGLALTTDVSKEADIQALVAQTESRFGRVDICCSNAGVGFADGSEGTAASAPNELWETSWQVNVMAHVYAARAALPKMLERRSGYFLNTVSAAGLLSQIGSASYSTTKHAAIGFAESLAIAHGEQGIGVSVLCPQGVATRLLARSQSDGPGPQSADGVLTPEQVADSVVEGLGAESFLILPHPGVLKYMQHKSADYDRWLGGMRRLRRQFSS